MLILGFPAQAFDTRCYVVAPAAGEECLVIDPGIGVVDHLAEILGEHRLRPAAVLVTHGHLDHIFSVTPVCGTHGVALSVHSEDRYRLVDPVSTLGPELKQMFLQQFGHASWKEPDDVRTIEDGQRLSIAGIDLDVIHAPGHTEGSVMFTLPGIPEALGGDSGLTSTLVSGDVLFAGSIGRTDLPGGNHQQLIKNIEEKLFTLPDDCTVYPGHGPETTIGYEKETNPFF
jgi:glyoxylase-like metal-dependent hydrolase (beta-lactamase superfamily II)